MKKKLLFISAVILLAVTIANAQQAMKHEDTELYTPVPPVVTPGKSCGDAPSDAIILFNGSNLNQWVLADDTTKAADWIVNDGIATVKKTSGNIQTRQSFTDYQLNRMAYSEDIEGADQARGNSGYFLLHLVKAMQDMSCKY